MRIEDLEPGDKVLTPSWVAATKKEAPEIDRATARLVTALLMREDGSWSKAKMLRDAQWLKIHRPEVGGTVWLDYPEMGVVGTAYVTSVGPCPEIADGPGRLVLTTFAHSATPVVSLFVSGEPTLIGTTPQHPFWSEDQRDWLGATALAVGERLEAYDGSTALALGWQTRDDEPVYNIEVEGDHC